MNIFVLAIVAGFAALLGVAIWFLRSGDRTVIDKLSAHDRVDGTRDPRAYLHHSSY